MNREQMENWLILEGWEPITHVSLAKCGHDPFPVLIKRGHGIAVCGMKRPYLRRVYRGRESWVVYFVSMEWRAITARHLAAIRKCLREDGLL